MTRLSSFAPSILGTAVLGDVTARLQAAPSRLGCCIDGLSPVVAMSSLPGFKLDFVRSESLSLALRTFENPFGKAFFLDLTTSGGDLVGTAHIHNTLPFYRQVAVGDFSILICHAHRAQLGFECLIVKNS
jgi:hypothetical protein